MRTPRRVLPLFGLAFVLLLFPDGPRAQMAPTAHIYGIGDLPGANTASAVRDATRVGGVIYAVGAGTAFNDTAPAQQLDSPILWTSANGGVITELPAAVPDLRIGYLGSQFSAYAITPSAEYIASQARQADTLGTPWVRVQTNLVPNVSSTMVLAPAFAFVALSISENGNVLYGQGQAFDGGIETRTPRRHLVGFGTTALDITPTGKPWGFPIPRGISHDGQIMVGAATDGHFTGTSTTSGPFGYPTWSTNSVGFRYRHDVGLTKLPHADASGTWSFPIALSNDGMVTLAAGNSAAHPNGELYLIDDADQRTRLGSPATGMVPRLLGGMTADGAVVVTFSSEASLGPGQIGGLGLPNGINQLRIPYLRNSHGWFMLGSALRALNLDLEVLGWDPTSMAVTGVRTAENHDLVFGQGRRRTINPVTGALNPAAELEGFVIEIPAGFLASFDAPATPPNAAAQSLIGAWVTSQAAVSVYLPDGRQIGFTQGASPFQNGFELATYSWGGNDTEWRLTHRLDGNGGQFGQHLFSAVRGRFVSIANDTLTLTNSHCSAPCPVNIPRVVGPAGSVVGAWRITNPDQPGGLGVIVLMSGDHGFRYFLMSQGGVDFDGSDTGTYVLNGTDITFSPAAGGIDVQQAVLSRDELSLDLGNPGEVYHLARIVNPSTVVPVFTGGLTAAATTGEPFLFTVDTRYAQTTTATNLPPGLEIDENTGTITGTPTAHGVYDVQLTGANTFNLSANATLTITVKSYQDVLTVSAPATAAYGQSFTATAGGGSGTGAVTFTASGACSNSNGSAQITMISGTGSCSIYAEKAGDASYHATTSEFVFVAATTATSTTSLQASPATSGPGQAVTFTASVTPQFGGAVSGTVSFRRGNTTLGIADVTPDGAAALVLTTLGKGSHVVTAIYSGDSHIVGSTSSSVTVNVVPPAVSSTTSITSSLNPSMVGDEVTFTATVSSAIPDVPTGTVTFKQGPTPVATVPLSGGQATYSTSSLPAGTTGLTAVYSGDATFLPSTSTSLTQQVNKAETTTTLISSVNPSAAGESVTFTVTVTSSSGGVPIGTVSLREGNAVLGSATLDASGVATITLSLTKGRHNIKALYPGDAAYGNSQSAVLGQNVK